VIEGGGIGKDCVDGVWSVEPILTRLSASTGRPAVSALNIVARLASDMTP